MIDKLRTAINGIFVKTVFIIIIISLLLTSIGKYLININSSNYAAKVNGTIISQIQLQQELQRQKQALEGQLNEQFVNFAKSKHGFNMLRRQSLEHLIKIILLNQYANQLGLTASDDQIKQDIYNMSVFHTNGNFDSKKYRDILSKYNINANDLVKEIRQNLIVHQLSKMYITDEFVLPEEINLYIKLLLQQREIRVATLFFDNYKSKQTVIDQELQEYYNTHQNKFISPEQVQVSYIKLDPASQHKNIVVKDNELKNFYEQNIASFTTPEQKKYSMIQVKSEKEADLVIKALSAGADFKQLVVQKSTDKFSVANDGVIGWMEYASTPNEIISANLTKKGQISRVIKLDSNYIIFRLDDIKPGLVKSFQSVKTEIANKLKNKKAINAFYSLQRTLSRITMKENQSLNAIEKATGIKAVRTDWFGRNNIPKEIRFYKIIDAIFNIYLVNKSRAIGISSDVINVDNNCAFIIRIEGYKPEKIKLFDEVKENIVKLVKYNKGLKDMELEGNKLLIALKEGTGKFALSNLGINFSDTKIIDSFGDNKEFIEEVFKMPYPKENMATYISTKDVNNNFIIVELLKVIHGQPTKELVNKFSKNYKMLLGSNMMESLIINLRDKAKIHLGQFE